jgi:ML domain
LNPDPPVKGETLSVDFKGYLKETVEEGAYVDVLVKYGVVKILQKRFDLCEQAGQVNKSCPVEKGDFTIDKDVELPKEIPPVSINAVHGMERTESLISASFVAGPLHRQCPSHDQGQ